MQSRTNTVPTAKGCKVKKHTSGQGGTGGGGGVSRIFKASYAFGGREHLKTRLASLGDH